MDIMAPSESEPLKKQRKQAKRRVRLIPMWLRFIIVPALLFLSLIIGAMVGYSVLGDGHPFDVLKKSTWQHIVQLVTED